MQRLTVFTPATLFTFSGESVCVRVGRGVATVPVRTPVFQKEAAGQTPVSVVEYEIVDASLHVGANVNLAHSGARGVRRWRT